MTRTAFPLLLCLGASLAVGETRADELTGTLVSATKAGRTAKLVVKTSDGEIEVSATSRTPVVVKAKGDVGFLSAEQFVTVEPQLSNADYFGKQFTVHLGKGRKPRQVFEKAPKQAGRAKNTYLVAGEIVSRQQDADYPEFQTIIVSAAGKKAKIFLDKGFQVQVVTNDVALAPAGSKVTLEGRKTRAKFVPSEIVISLAKPLSSEKLLAADE